MSNQTIKAIYLNCSLKESNQESHTQTLMDKSIAIMKSEGVEVETIHLRDHEIGVGMSKDTSEETGTDDWPSIQTKIMDADILVVGTPIWLGVKSSVATLAIERLYAYSSDTNDKGQYAYYGKVGGCVITGNEDGIKHCAMDILYSLQHMGYTIPPQADCGWIGEVGPGPSYGDTTWKGEKINEDGSPVGVDNEFTNRNTTFMTWNLLHAARMLKSQDGIPAKGNTKEGWEDVVNAKSDNPEYQ